VPKTRLESVDDDEASERFVHEAMHGLAELGPEDLEHENLTLPLSLSLWMRRGGVGLDDARRALFDLRRALLRVAALDEGSEPVPLVVADPVAATLSLAVYLDGLLSRAARATDTSRLDVAERAVAHLVA